MTGVCPCCGTAYGPGDYRCGECGKDLVDVDESSTRSVGWSP